MNSSQKLAGLALGLTAILAAPALAQDSATRAPVRVDPNQIICEKQEVLGSRLATKRVCLTRTQWAQRKQMDREDLERTQQQRGMKSN
jgi:hypothetical protein